jgi:single-strand DNA-binding protein
MNETMVTLVGHVATEPALRTTTGGARVTSFRLASTERRFDKGVNDWRDAHTTFFTVTSWRNMAENVCTSVHKGQPVVVHGRLRDSSYESKEGQWRTVLEVEAFAMGHDLSRGVSSFDKSTSSSSVNIVRELEEFGDVDPVTGEIRDLPVDDGFDSSYDDPAVAAGATPTEPSAEPPVEPPGGADADGDAGPRTRSTARAGRTPSAA